MTADEERELLISAAASAHRARDAEGTIVPSSAWMDLDAAGRREVFHVAGMLRALERASDPRGLSSTTRAVLARIRKP